MSLDALEVMRQNRDDQFDLGAFSEEFTIIDSGGLSIGTFNGVFSEYHIENEMDNGNNKKKRVRPIVLVSVQPPELVGKESDYKVRRELNSDEFTFQFFGKNTEGIPVLWLV